MYLTHQNKKIAESLCLPINHVAARNYDFTKRFGSFSTNFQHFNNNNLMEDSIGNKLPEYIALQQGASKELQNKAFKVSLFLATCMVAMQVGGTVSYSAKDKRADITTIEDSGFMFTRSIEHP